MPSADSFPARGVWIANWLGLGIKFSHRNIGMILVSVSAAFLFLTACSTSVSLVTDKFCLQVFETFNRYMLHEREHLLLGIFVLISFARHPHPNTRG